MMNCSRKETQVKLRNPELKEVQQRRGEEREREQVISAEKMTPARAVNPPPAEVVFYTERL